MAKGLADCLKSEVICVQGSSSLSSSVYVIASSSLNASESDDSLAAIVSVRVKKISAVFFYPCASESRIPFGAGLASLSNVRPLAFFAC